MDWAASAMELLWVGGLTAVPLALLVALASRWPGCRPATRHALWVAVLVSFVTPAVATLVWRPTWFESSRLLGVAERAIARLQAELVLDAVVTPPPVGGVPVGGVKDAAPVSAPVKMATGNGSGPERAAPRDRRAPRTDMRTANAPRAARGSENAPAPKTERPAIVERTQPAPAAGSNNAAERAGSKETKFAPSLAAVEEKVIGAASEKSTPPRVENRAPAASSSVMPGGATFNVAPEKEKPVIPLNPEASGGRAAPLPAAAPGLAPETLTDVKTAGDRWATELRSWVAQALTVRDAVAGLPPIPTSIWGGGVLVLLIIGVARVVSFRRVLRHACGAPVETMEMVRDAAAELGMRRAPVTLVTGDRVSPMVWCGLRARLVLPVGLWRELDAGSRRAVLLHELAHLKRRDHWLAWLGAAVGLVYWWHPVAWWARKRIRDEADASCDAWVTSLMPTSRRVYAEALVTTKWFLSCPGRRVPRGLAGSGALGVMTGRTKHLARRLKMVMTQRVSPRTSLTGSLMVLGVLATGMFVMPGLACPPEEAAAAKERATQARVVATRAAQEAKAVKAAKAPKAAKAEKAEKTAKAKTEKGQQKSADVVEFYGEAPALEAMRKRDAEGAAGKGAQNKGGDDEMLRRLEERLRRLEEQLRRLERRSDATPAPRAGGGMSAWSTTPVPTEAGAPAAGVWIAGHGDAAPVAIPDSAPHPYSVALTSPGMFSVVTDDGVEVVREYVLPGGKLEALRELMAREDVPVLIERHDDKIVLHAPESKQRVFAAFVKLIHPEAQVVVPDFPGMATLYEHAVRDHAAAVNDMHQAHQNHQQHLDQMKQQLKMIERQRNDAERAAEKARERSEATEEQIEELHDHLNELREHAEDDEGQVDMSKIEAEVAKIMAKVEGKTQSMAAMLADAEVKESMVSSLEDAMEQLEQAIEEMADRLSEEIEATIEDSVGAMEAPTPTIAFTPMAPMAGMPGMAPTPATTPVAPAAPVAPAGAAPAAPPVPPTPAALPPSAPAPAAAPTPAPAPTPQPAIPSTR